jgi:hypothetical protein
MNLKKIYSTFICYVTLLALISVISFEVSSHSDLLHKKTEISTSKSDISNNMNLAFEEERDTDDQTDHSILSLVYFNSSSLTQVHIINYNVHFFKNQVISEITKTPLFISQRTLRI